MAEALKERGFFWWFGAHNRPANSQETSVPALLTISDDGRITLEADGALCQKGEYEDRSRLRSLPESERIAGRLVSSGDYVLLEGLERTDFSFPDESPPQQCFSAHQCVHRQSPFPDSYGRDNFIELRIDLSGFEEWLRLESIVVERESYEEDVVDVRVRYKEWKLRYGTLGGTLSIESITTGAPIISISKQPVREVRFKQNYYIVFCPDAPSGVSGLRGTYTRLEELLGLLIGTYRKLPAPIVVTKEEPFDAWNTLYFHSGTRLAQAIIRSSIWVSFEHVRTLLGDLFQNWVKGSQSYGAGYYLYVASLRNPHHYSEDRFVNLVWGIEALHRKLPAGPETSERADRERKRIERILHALQSDSNDQKWLKKKLAHAHEPSLEARILECLKKLPFTFDQGELEKFSKTCADRRNDISHAGGPREDVDYDSFHLEISRLADALDHLFHALLLRQVGVEPTVILNIMTNSLVSPRIGIELANAGLHIKSTS